MLLIAGATTLQFKIKNAVNNLEENVIKPDHFPSKVLTVIAFATLVAGTIVTGTGPHAGDIDSPRFGFSLYFVTRIHTALVALTIATTIYLLWRAPRIEIKWLIAVILGQGFIGYLQWHLGLPEALVGLHLLGSVLFWFATWRVRLSFKYGSIKSKNNRILIND
jgi:cytochrome c oxidase assembly protein subunit 15